MEYFEKREIMKNITITNMKLIDDESEFLHINDMHATLNRLSESSL